jgi:C-terminal processing protease CtpA/Prc
MWFLHFAPEDEDAFALELEGAFSSLADTESIVLDIRLHAGGDDTSAFLVASHFVPERMLAFSKQAVDGDGYTDSYDVYVEPGLGPTYDGKVIVIISGSTVSAAETFAMTMAQLPQTILLGRNTTGATSNTLARYLPNGWAFWFSNEVSMAPDGAIYEAFGIPPDILPDADLLPLSEREAGIDSWLEMALEMARQ